MSDMLSQLYKLLVDVVLPNLKGIQASHAEQRLQTEQLNRNLDEFRAEMRVRFTEIRAELAVCRVQVEDAMVTLRETETAEADDSASQGKKTLIH
jgi:predicted phage gp36 major capsid-like protein